MQSTGYYPRFRRPECYILARPEFGLKARRLHALAKHPSETQTNYPLAQVDFFNEISYAVYRTAAAVHGSLRSSLSLSERILVEFLGCRLCAQPSSSDMFE